MLKFWVSKEHKQNRPQMELDAEKWLSWLWATETDVASELIN